MLGTREAASENPVHASAQPSRLAYVLLRTSAFLIVPALLLLLCARLQEARGPYWASVIDPDYAYLFNSLNVARFQSAPHIHHPGSPLHILGAVVLRVTHACVGQGRIVDDVIDDPELYLRAIAYTCLTLYLVTLFLGGLLAFRLTGSWLQALLLQLAPFYSVEFLDSLLRVTPEALHFVFVAVLASAILFFLERGRPEGKRFAWIFGILNGLNIATKVSAAPLAVIPLILLPTWRDRLRFVLVAVGTFVLVTIPAWPGYASLGTFVLNTATHSGLYGSGAVGLVDETLLAPFLVQVCREQFLFVVVMLAGTALSLAVLWKHRSAAKVNRLYALGLLAVIVGQFLQFLIVAKHPRMRYLVPALALLALDFVLLARILHEAAGKKAVACLLGLLALWFAAFESPWIERKIAGLAQAKRERLAFVAELNRTPSSNHKAFLGPRTYSPPYALSFGNAWAGWKHGEVLARQYPDVFTIDSQHVFDFHGLRSLQEELGERQTVWLQCSWRPEGPAGLEFDLVYQSGDQLLYRLTRNSAAAPVQVRFHKPPPVVMSQAPSLSGEPLASAAAAPSRLTGAPHAQ